MLSAYSYSFGSTMKGRTFSDGSRYRYGMNGQEKDDEIAKGIYTAEFWQYDSRLGRRWNLDPKPVTAISQYACFANSPIWMQDVKGDTAAVFYPDGTFWRIENDGKKEWTILHYTTSSTVIKNVGGVQATITTYSKPNTYQFADKVNDPKDIKNGVINKLIFVDEKKIGELLGKQGALDEENRLNALDYMNTESKGGQKLDFSYSVIPNEFPGASSDPLNVPSSMLFIPKGQNFAHNHMNFGNFLWGAAGKALGFGNLVLKMAAQYNSYFNSETNGYPAQWDSNDDQLSIELGGDYSSDHQFNIRTYDSKTNKVSPLGKR